MSSINLKKLHKKTYTQLRRIHF